MASATSDSRAARNPLGLAVVLSLALQAGCGSSAVPEAGLAPSPGVGDQRLLRAGAATIAVPPSVNQVMGVEESRPLGRSTTQYFHLGGFGLGPFPALPDLLNNLFANPPAGATVYEGPFGPEPIWLRAMVISSAESDLAAEDVLFLTLDAVGTGNTIQREMRERISVATGLPPNNILLGSTHTHAGPDLQGLWGGVPRSWLDNDDPLQPGLYQAGVRAAQTALANREPARLRVMETSAPEFNSYRRARILGSEQADDSLMMLQAARAGDGAAIGSIVQYNAHPTNIGAGENPRIPHPDYVVGVIDAIERAHGGTALFYNGAIADASNQGPDADDRYTRSRLRGEAIAERLLEAWPQAAVELPPTLAFRSETVLLPLLNPLFLLAGVLGSFDGYYQFALLPPFEDTQLLGDVLGGLPVVGPLLDVIEALPLIGAGDLINLPLIEPLGPLGELLAEIDAALPQLALSVSTPVSRVTIGDPNGLGLEMVTIPGEATNTLGQDIRALSSASHTMLLGLTQNSFGYIIPLDEFVVGEILAGSDPYEELVSLGALTAPLLMLQAYRPLFDAPMAELGGDPLSACLTEPSSTDCLIARVLVYLRNSFILGWLSPSQVLGANAAPVTGTLP
ncbi:hypothetical protein [Sinimarinibacterium flocculans]|uniref:Neutral/alkaline ceramidase-like enzyme n=1 Tax=Sinimarinibacterium flocculans TaxID=985250 RepID=A0A318E5T7_9GAMM|nr:hypothetical protein [Sinimarinibacterium flocculans]PXV64289.1 hypothetical protein C8D93_11383 [Sinimarinibacterium flocculans]